MLLSLVRVPTEGEHASFPAQQPSGKGRGSCGPLIAPGLWCLRGQ